MVKIAKVRLSNQVYAALKEMIANHRFQPGTRINIERLTKELGTSRTPIWEAVHRLMQEGLLRDIPNRGVFMVELTPSLALELYSVREALEALAARCAVRKIDDKTLRRMKRCLEAQRKVIEKRDLVGYSTLDFEFHALVYEACGNAVLKEMLETIKSKMRPISMHIDIVLPQLYAEHEEIVRALEERDEQRAEKAFNVHNRHIIRQIEENSRGDAWIDGVSGEKGQSRSRSSRQTVPARRSARTGHL
jgi:DNA-binding GntR family transcriptional regulator